MFMPLFSMVVCLDASSPPLEFYDKGLREFSSLMGVYLQIDGDPFHYHQLNIFLEKCEKYGITNIGVRTDNLYDDNLEILRKFQLRSIMFRMQSTNSLKNDFLLQKGNALEQLKENIRLAKSVGMSTEVSVILCKENYQEFEQIISWSENNDIDILVVERNIIANYRKYPLTDIDPLIYKQILLKIVNYNQVDSKTKTNKLSIALSHCPNKILVHENKVEYQNALGGCSAGIISCAVDTTGEIVPCLPLHEVKLGNIRNKSLSDIWQKSPELVLLRDRENLDGKCGRCEYKYSCGGCRAESYIRTHSLLGEDSTCWKL